MRFKVLYRIVLIQGKVGKVLLIKMTPVSYKNLKIDLIKCILMETNKKRYLKNKLSKFIRKYKKKLKN